MNLDELLKDYKDIPQEPIDLLARLDATTYNHSIRVCKFCRLIEDEFSLPNRKLSQAGLVHDIGKYFITSKVLDKKGKLDEIERKVIDLHAYIGYLILKHYDVDDVVCKMVLYHHTFSPVGFSSDIKFVCNNENIKKYTLMLKTIDMYEALTTDRPYHRRVSNEEAVDMIKQKNEYNSDTLRIISTSEV